MEFSPLPALSFAALLHWVLSGSSMLGGGREGEEEKYMGALHCWGLRVLGYILPPYIHVTVFILKSS